MGLFAPETERRVIPRWRESGITAESGELNPTGRPISRPNANRRELDRALNAWRREQSIETATEALSTAVVFGEPWSAKEAADYLSDPASKATPAVKALASAVSAGRESERHHGEIVDIGGEEHPSPSVLHAKIRRLKGQLREVPRNAIRWVDLARAYCIIGQNRRSIDTMDIALRLAPTNRFVLRSAARLFVHVDEPDRAHDLLRRNDRTRRDPWLLSAEIAVASVAERSSHLTRQARTVLGAGIHLPRNTAELASAMATLELTAGQLRQARKLFRQSLTDPTENAVAQAEWATKKDPEIDVSPEVIREAKSHEAQALADYRAANWAGVMAECRHWLADEPFSSRPAAWGSYLALITLNDDRLGEDFARRGLFANPDDPLLLNNLAVALADRGEVDEARKCLSQVLRQSVSGQLKAALLATEGLVNFRSGNIVEGRRYYEEAAVMAAKAGWRSSHALALVHLAREEMRLGSALTEAAFRLAAQACEEMDAAPEIRAMLERVRVAKPPSPR